MKTRNAPFSNNEEDRISSLTDALIHHIFSFIDMKYVIPTCILSRRWRYLWTSLPTLNFNSKLFKSENDIEDFIDFVDKVLLVRDSSDIRRFYLNLDLEDKDLDEDCGITSRLNTWIIDVVRRNVQELTVKVDEIYDTIQFPPCFFTCKSLTKMELALSKYDSKFILPTSMDLPQLKSLQVYGVSISDEEFTDKLFSGCPVLESLIIKDCQVNLNNISSLKLKHFKFEYDYYDPDENEAKTTIKLYAPNLTSFIYKSYMSHDYALENLSSLVTADIHMMVEDEEDDESSETFPSLSAEVKQLYAHNMIKLLRALHTVNDLALSPWLLEVISGFPNLLDNQSPQFCNLRCLKLRTFLSRDCFPAITYLFRISPNMECLTLVIRRCRNEPQMYPFCDEINSSSPIIGDDCETGLSLPCMLYHLKFVKVIGVQGRINELKFFEILLKNAMVLKKVVLYWNWKDQSDMAGRMKNFSEKLVTIPRASSSVAFMCF